jgi:hypothetical protein
MRLSATEAANIDGRGVQANLLPAKIDQFACPQRMSERAGGSERPSLGSVA